MAFERHRLLGPLRGMSDAEVGRALRDGTAKRHGGYVLPVMRGGTDLEEVLGIIDKRLETLATAKAAGDDTGDAEAARLTGERKQVEEALAAIKAGTIDSNTLQPVDQTKSAEEQLAEYRRRDTLKSQADAITNEIVKRVREDQQREATELAAVVQAQVAQALGHNSVDDAVKAALANVRQGSAFIGAGADTDAVKAVIEGRALDPANFAQAKGTQQDRELQGLVESKSLMKFMRCISRIKGGVASPAERLFVLSGGTGDTKALAEGTPSAGGYLVRPEWMPDVLGLLRGSAVVRAAGPRIQPFNRLMNQTQLSTGATAFYTAENAAIPKSEQTFAEVPLLTPKNLTGLVPVSNYLLNDEQVGGGAEDIVRSDLVVVMALREDLAFLRGDGSGGSPTGFRFMAGISLDPLGASPANGFQPTLGQLRRMIAVFRTQNAVNIRPVWFFNPGFLTYLEGLTDTLGRFLVDTTLLTYNTNAALGGDAGNIMSGTFLGIPFFATNQLPANLTQGSASNSTEVYLVNMAETIVGINQELEIDMSSEASYTPDGGTTWINAFQNNQTLFRAVIRHDIAHRRAQQVLVQRGVLV